MVFEADHLSRPIIVRRVAAGILAGACVVATAVVAFALVMLSSGLVGSLYTLSAQLYGNLTIGEAFRSTLLLDLNVFLFVVWSGRWALPGLCLLGCLLAGAELNVDHVRLRGRYHLGLAVTLGALATTIFWFQFATYSQPLLLLGVVIALAGTWILWAGWVTWYYLWVIWLNALPPRRRAPAIAPPIAREFLLAQARIAWLKRTRRTREPNPFRTPPEQIVVAEDRVSRRPYIAAWLGVSLIVVLIKRLLFPLLVGDVPHTALAPLFGVVGGLWFGLGALLLIEVLIDINWLDPARDDALENADEPEMH